MPHYTKEELQRKKYTVYVDNVRYDLGNVYEADTDEGWAVIDESSCGSYGILTKVKKYGRVHLVIEYDLCDDCECDKENCDSCDCDKDDSCDNKANKSNCGGCGNSNGGCGGWNWNFFDNDDDNDSTT